MGEALQLEPTSGAETDVIRARSEPQKDAVWRKAAASGSHNASCVRLGTVAGDAGERVFLGISDSKNPDVVLNFMDGDAAVAGVVACAKLVEAKNIA